MSAGPPQTPSSVKRSRHKGSQHPIPPPNPRTQPRPLHQEFRAQIARKIFEKPMFLQFEWIPQFSGHKQSCSPHGCKSMIGWTWLDLARPSSTLWLDLARPCGSTLWLDLARPGSWLDLARPGSTWLDLARPSSTWLENLGLP